MNEEGHFPWEHGSRVCHNTAISDRECARGMVAVGYSRDDGDTFNGRASCDRLRRRS